MNRDDPQTDSYPLTVSRSVGAESRVSRIWAALLPLFGGLLTTLSVPPFGWWPLGIVGLGVLTWSFLRHWPVATKRQRFRAGLLFGLGLYVVSLSWMAQFTLPGAIFVAALESVITALTFLLLPRRNAAPFVPAAIVGADALRSLWPFGGLPLGGIDLGQAAGPLAPSVSFGGRLLLIGLTAAIGAIGAYTIARFLFRTHTYDWHIAGTALGCSLVILAVTFLPTGARNDGDTFRLAVVQGGGPRGELANTNNARRTFEAHLAATRSLSEGNNLDAVLWPENTVDVVQLESSNELVVLTAEASRLRAPILVGAVEDLNEKFALNEQAVITPEGKVAERFEKVRRVPYGEYFPFRSIIGRLAPLPKRDFRPGTKPGTITAKGVKFAIAISYEGFFDDRSRGGVRAGGRAVLIPTNASSYVTSQVPTQQIAAARLRARETGRWTVQAGPTGLSAIIDPDGTVHWRSVIERRETHTVDLPLRSGRTPYVHFNDAPMVALVLACLVWSRVRAKARFRRRS